MKINEIIAEAPMNPIGRTAFAAGQATAKGVQGVKNLGQAAGQAAATGAEKTANVIAKGAQKTHDIATKAAGVLDKGTSAVQGLKKTVGDIGQFGTSGFMAGGKGSTTSRGSGDVGDALSDIQPTELKQMLMAISSGKELTPWQKQQLGNAAYKL
jgi:hypothetical protein